MLIILLNLFNIILILW